MMDKVNNKKDSKNNKKNNKNKMKSTLLDIGVICALLLTLLASVFLIRNYGEYCLIYHLLGGIYLTIEGIGIIAVEVIDYNKKKGQMPKASLGVYILGIMLMMLLILYGGVSSYQAIKDMNTEPEEIYLWNCSTRISVSGGRYRVRRKMITGQNGINTYSFDLTGIGKEEWSDLQENSKTVVIYYYPASKSVYRIDEVRLIDYLEQKNE